MDVNDSKISSGASAANPPSTASGLQFVNETELLYSCANNSNDNNDKTNNNSSSEEDNDWNESSNPESSLKPGKKTRGRVRIKMEYIKDKVRRYTTFSKRKAGIMKKAYELTELTGTQLMLLVASETGHVYTFATEKFKPMIDSKAWIEDCIKNESKDARKKRTYDFVDKNKMDDDQEEEESANNDQNIEKNSSQNVVEFENPDGITTTSMKSQSNDNIYSKFSQVKQEPIEKLVLHNVPSSTPMDLSNGFNKKFTKNAAQTAKRQCSEREINIDCPAIQVNRIATDEDISSTQSTSTEKHRTPESFTVPDYVTIKHLNS